MQAVASISKVGCQLKSQFLELRRITVMSVLECIVPLCFKLFDVNIAKSLEQMLCGINLSKKLWILVWINHQFQNNGSNRVPWYDW